jgi:hypothetical protein
LVSFAELLVYDVELSDADRMSVEAYLDAKYFQAPEPVPTLTEWGIFFLIVLLAGAAFFHVRKLQSDSMNYRFFR